jgi:hypothetical protein
MTIPRVLELVGILVGAASVALGFTPLRSATARRPLAVVGALIALCGYASEPLFHDGSTWASPMVYLGLALGAGLPFLFAFVVLRLQRTRER